MNSEKSHDTGSNTKVSDIAPKSRGVCFIRTWTRRTILGAGLISIATAAFILSPLQNMVYASMDAQDDLTRADYIICLGGDPGRVLEATRLLSDDYAPILIVTNHGSAAEQMRRIAIEWGASPSRVLMDDSSQRTADHPVAVARVGDIDIENDTCIIVTSYTHLAHDRGPFLKRQVFVTSLCANRGGNGKRGHPRDWAGEDDSWSFRVSRTKRRHG